MIADIDNLNKEMEEKRERIKWQETKLNKWITLFQDSEKSGYTRHKTITQKIEDLDKIARK